MDISDMGENGEKVSGFCLPSLFISMFCLIYTWTRIENKNSKNWNEMFQLFRSYVAWGFRFWGGEGNFVLRFSRRDISILI